MTTYRTCSRPTAAESKVKGSRFLALLEPCCDRDTAEKRLAELREKYRDSTHVCWAWRLLSEAEPGEASSDDGEPAGTAGVPILGVLRSMELWNTLGVVVRWFGGTKLGRSGLIRAYRDALATAVETAEIVEKLPLIEVEVRSPVEQVGNLHRVLSVLDVTYHEQSVDGGVAIVSVSLPSQNLTILRDKIVEATRGVGTVKVPNQTAGDESS